MEMTLTRTTVPVITFSIDRHVNNAAANGDNPLDGIGVFHNVFVERLAVAAAVSRLDDTPMSREAALTAAREVFSQSKRWRFHCVCVQEEGCPCKTIWDLVSRVFDRDGVARVLESFRKFPSSPLTVEQVEELVGPHLSEDFDAFSGGLRQMVGDIEHLSAGELRLSEFFRKMRDRESRWQRESIAPRVLDSLLTGASVARHSVFSELVSKPNPVQAPEWAKDDAMFGIAGSALFTPAVGLGWAGIASISTATGVW
ncbi:hypothetical protein ACL02O_31280 [Micromonospora sp. MS34]|uniref:hypothetical protein n=1 Tax=Micromonospora sp. MS34 TaxID=3385971 RepID=UPI0039A2D5B9